MKKLIGIREFVLLEYSKRNAYYYQDSKVLNKINNYANFLSRQPKLSDFVPCGEDGLPIEKPSEHLENRSLYYQELEAYQQALDKVLFKGWVYYEKDSISSDFYDIKIMNFGDRNVQFYIKDYTKEVKHQEFVRITTLESLTPYNLELTENAKIIINGNV